MKAIQLVLLFSILNLFISYGATATPYNSCVRLLSKDYITELKQQNLPTYITNMLKHGRLQSAYWSLKSEGYLKESLRLKKYIESVFKSFDNTEILHQEWDLFSAGFKGKDLLFGNSPSEAIAGDRNMNTSYLVTKDGIKFIIKFTDGAINEQAAYQIAELINFQVPITLAITVGGRPAAAQLFVEDAVNLGDFSLAKEESDEGLNSLSLSIFQEIIQKEDDTVFNIMVVEKNMGDDMGMPATERNRIAFLLSIDHDLSFDKYFSFVEENAGMMPSQLIRDRYPYPAFWLTKSDLEQLEILATMKKDHLDMHKALMDPKTLPSILKVIDQTEASSDYKDWVSVWFSRYRAISK